jgi:RND family efflux transporter MFP subunit
MKIEKAKALQLEAAINRDEEVRRAGRSVPGSWILITLLLPALAAGMWWMNKESQKAPPTQAAPSEASIPSEAPASAEAEPKEEFSAAGYVEPAPPFPVKITPLVPGRIDRFTIREGERIQAGEVVARMNTEQHENRAGELKAAAAVNQQRLDFAARELARAQTLAGRGATPLRDLDQASSEVEILRAEAERLQMELESVLWRIEKSAVRSPVDGVLYERAASEGEFINLDERHEIASVIDPRQMQVWVDINQRDLAKISENGVAMVSFEAEPGREFRAKVDRILPKATLAKNTVRVVLHLEEFSPALRPEMSVKVVFPKP